MVFKIKFNKTICDCIFPDQGSTITWIDILHKNPSPPLKENKTKKDILRGREIYESTR